MFVKTKLAMEDIEKDFRNYLLELLDKIPKPDSDTAFAPNMIKYGHYTREFIREASRKLDEISSSVRDQPEEWERLTNILTEYRTKLMTGQF